METKFSKIFTAFQKTLQYIIRTTTNDRELESTVAKIKKNWCLSMTFDNLNHNLLVGNPKSYQPSFKYCFVQKDISYKYMLIL